LPGNDVTKNSDHPEPQAMWKSQYTWLRVKLPSEKIITGIITRGDEATQQWELDYFIEHSKNCRNFTKYTNPGKFLPEVILYIYLHVTVLRINIFLHYTYDKKPLFPECADRHHDRLLNISLST
jgi:hypothetical protein